MGQHVEGTGEMNSCRFLEETQKERDHLKDLSNDRRCNEIESERNTDGMVKIGLT